MITYLYNLSTYDVSFFFFFNDTATTEIYTYLTHSFPTRRSSDLSPRRWTPGRCRQRHAVIWSSLWSAWSGPPQSLTNNSDWIRYVLQQSRSEEHTSELQSLMRISYAVFCLKKKKHRRQHY